MSTSPELSVSSCASACSSRAGCSKNFSVLLAAVAQVVTGRSSRTALTISVFDKLRIVLVDEREGLARRVQEVRRELLDLPAEGLGVRLAHRAALLELLLEGLGDGVLPACGTTGEPRRPGLGLERRTTRWRRSRHPHPCPRPTGRGLTWRHQQILQVFVATIHEEHLHSLFSLTAIISCFVKVPESTSIISKTFLAADRNSAHPSAAAAAQRAAPARP